MNQSWITTTIEKLCNIEYGTRVVRKKDAGTIYPVYGGGGATFSMDIFNREDRMVIARFAMSEKCTRFISGKFFLNDSGLTISPKEKELMNTKFLNYQILSLNDTIYSIGRGTAQRNLNSDAFKNLTISYPKSFEEQKQIVEILDNTFETIEQAKANIEKNIQNTKELFQSRLNEIFSQKGDGWEEKKWGDVCTFVRGPFGGSLKKSMFKEEGYVVYEQKHAIHNHFNQLRYFIDEDKFNEMKRFELKPGDLIMSCSGVTLGRVAIAGDNIKKGIINQALLKLTPSNNLRANFVKYWIQSDIFQKIIFKYAKGAAIPNVPSAKIMKDIDFYLPSIEKQDEIINYINDFKNKCNYLENQYQQKLKNLEELKKSILQKAFSGELIP